jgi:hypothetical protein
MPKHAVVNHLWLDERVPQLHLNWMEQLIISPIRCCQTMVDMTTLSGRRGSPAQTAKKCRGLAV